MAIHLCQSSCPLAFRKNLILDFLAPSLFNVTKARSFSTTQKHQSKVGASPLLLPADVHLKLLEPPKSRKTVITRHELLKTVKVEGPLGELTLQIPTYMSLNHNEKTRKATLAVVDYRERKQREMWGTTRSYLKNHILGVTEGHTAILRLVGVGYRATLESKAITRSPEYPGQQFISLKLGFTQPIELGVPLGMKASVPQPTRILLEGIEKEVVMQFAAKIRMWRKPEPYKGKGIFVNGETIKLKAKKIK